MDDQGTVGVQGIQGTAPKHGGRVATSQNSEISTGGGLQKGSPGYFCHFDPGIINRLPVSIFGVRSRKKVTGFLFCGIETQAPGFVFLFRFGKIKPGKQEIKEETASDLPG